MIVARTAEEFRQLGPGHYVGISYETGPGKTLAWVTPDDEIVPVQRRINEHRLDPAHHPLRIEDVDEIRAWWRRHQPKPHRATPVGKRKGSP